MVFKVEYRSPQKMFFKMIHVWRISSMDFATVILKRWARQPSKSYMILSSNIVLFIKETEPAATLLAKTMKKRRYFELGILGFKFEGWIFTLHPKRCFSFPKLWMIWIDEQSEELQSFSLLNTELGPVTKIGCKLWGPPKQVTQPN